MAVVTYYMVYLFRLLTDNSGRTIEPSLRGNEGAADCSDQSLRLATSLRLFGLSDFVYRPVICTEAEPL